MGIPACLTQQGRLLPCRHALQLRVGKCVSYLRAHVLGEVAGLKRQVRELEKSEELMSTSRSSWALRTPTVLRRYPPSEQQRHRR